VASFFGTQCRITIFTRDSIYAIACICHANSVCTSVRMSVRLSHACFVSKRLHERIIEILSLSDRPIILGFRHQGSLLKSEGFIPNGSAKYRGGSNFRPICGYISETVIDRGIVTNIWKTNIKSYVLYRILPLWMTLSDPESVSRSQYTLKVNISQTVHLIHSMFASSLEYRGRRIARHYLRFDKI